MKFENPMMTISMFEVENVVTESAPVDPTKSASAAVDTFISDKSAPGTTGGYKIVF